MLRRPILPIALALAVVLSLVPGSMAQSAPVQEDIARRFLAELNAERAARGVGALQWDGAIAGESAAWASQLSSSGALRHSRSGRGEIIGQGARTGQITELWMRSGPHRNLLVDPNFVAAGIGVHCDASGRMWAVVQFRQGDPRIGTLSSSPVEPKVTAGGSGVSCPQADPGAELAIRRLYRAYFLRDAEPAGLHYWRGQVQAGVGLRTVSDSFASSAEFRARYGTVSDRDFVVLVYRNVLGREPDGPGLTHWLGVVRRSGRGEVMLSFAESAEFRVVTGLR